MEPIAISKLKSRISERLKLEKECLDWYDNIGCVSPGERDRTFGFVQVLEYVMRTLEKHNDQGTH